jgi:hypothetical protein
MTSNDNLIKSDMPSVNESVKTADDDLSGDLMDETLKLITDYEEGLTARDFKSMADCTCGSESSDHAAHASKSKEVAEDD